MRYLRALLMQAHAGAVANQGVAVVDYRGTTRTAAPSAGWATPACDAATAIAPTTSITAATLKFINQILHPGGNTIPTGGSCPAQESRPARPAREPTQRGTCEAGGRADNSTYCYDATTHDSLDPSTSLRGYSCSPVTEETSASSRPVVVIRPVNRALGCKSRQLHNVPPLNRRDLTVTYLS
jgi:hypothetical protein